MRRLLTLVLLLGAAAGKTEAQLPSFNDSYPSCTNCVAALLETNSFCGPDSFDYFQLCHNQCLLEHSDAAAEMVVELTVDCAANLGPSTGWFPFPALESKSARQYGDLETIAKPMGEGQIHLQLYNSGPLNVPTP